MRILLGIGKSVVHAVQDGVSSGTQVRGALCDVRKNKKEFFPKTAHGKCFVRRIAVQEKSLRKKRGIPMHYEEDKNNNHF